jgi:phage/plasmid-like protein (TIGR03299 family)
MFSARQVPWHFSMTQDRTIVTDDNLTMEEAIPSSGLDWKVERVPIYTQRQEIPYSVEGVHVFPTRVYDEVPGMIGLQRSTDHKILGIHTDQYQENQPREMFEWGWGIIEAALEDGATMSPVWETGGSLAGGKRIFAMIKMPEIIQINGDRHVPYLGLADSFDGSLARRAWMTFVRVVCQNTLDWSWSNAITKIAIRHTKNSDSRIAAARQALGISYKNLDAFEQEVDQMMNTLVTDEKFFSLVEGLFPEPKQEETRTARENRMRRRRTVLDVYYNSSTVGEWKGTAWGALNAVQEWEQWSARGRTSKQTQRQVANRQLAKVVGGTWPTTIKAARQLVRSS